MQKKLLVSLASVAALAMSLTACGEQGGSSKLPTYNYIYTADAQTFDYGADYHSTTFDVMANLVEGLLEYNQYGILQGALAETWEHNADNTVWTFHLRKGIQWVNDQGKKYGEVTADDFVAGMQHVLDVQGGAEYVAAPILNANEYMAGSVTDFSQVGVKAQDKYTLVYTLNTPTPYFESTLEYGPFWPVNREFFQSKGCGFGSEWNAETCKFGVLGDTSSVLYNGAFYLGSYVTESKIEFVANPEYWDAKSLKISGVNLTFDDGSNLDARFSSFADGHIDALGISETLLSRARSEFGNNIYVTTTDDKTCTYYGAFNINRQTFDNGANLHSAKTEKQQADAKLAILNKNFRKAFYGAWDTASYNAASVGQDLKDKALRNIMETTTMVSLSEAYGPFAKGTQYGDMVEYYLNQKVASEDALFDGDISDGHAAYYNPTKAKAWAAKAKEELSAQGVEFPIVIDIMYYGASETQKNQAQSTKASIEGNLGTDFIRVDTHAAATSTEYYYSGYYADAVDVFYDFYYGSGWCPDYADPQTYLNCYVEGGDMMNHIAYDASVAGDRENYQAVLGKYNEMCLAAEAEVSDVNKRYALFAEAEAELLAQSFVLPQLTQGGTYAVTRVIPHSVAYNPAGTDDSKFKWTEIADHVLTTAEVEQYRKDWAAERARRLAA